MSDTGQLQRVGMEVAVPPSGYMQKGEYKHAACCRWFISSCLVLTGLLCLCLYQQMAMNQHLEKLTACGLVFWQHTVVDVTNAAALIYMCVHWPVCADDIPIGQRALSCCCMAKSASGCLLLNLVLVIDE